MGDPACLMASICLSCGRHVEAAEDGTCPHCGHEFEGADFVDATEE